jgi:phosphatidylserine decarboxylase
MIKFGSRVDLILPADNSEILVHEGEKPKAGETIVARMF